MIRLQYISSMLSHLSDVYTLFMYIHAEAYTLFKPSMQILENYAFKSQSSRANLKQFVQFAMN